MHCVGLRTKFTICQMQVLYKFTSTEKFIIRHNFYEINITQNSDYTRKASYDKTSYYIFKGLIGLFETFKKKCVMFSTGCFFLKVEDAHVNMYILRIDTKNILTNY